MSFYATAFDRFVRRAMDGLVPPDAETWELYASKPGAEQAAVELSAKLRKMLSQIGQSFAVGMHDFERCLEKHADLGATDTEPRAALHRAVRALLEYLSREMI